MHHKAFTYLRHTFTKVSRAWLTLRAHHAHFEERWHRGTNARTLLILVVLGAASGLAYLHLIAAPDPFPVDDIVTVPRGISLSEVAYLLEEKNVVRDALSFRIVMTVLGKASSARAGDYLFKEPKNLFAVARILSQGAYGLEPERITVPEGATTREMGKLFAGRLKRIDEETFVEKALPFEGYLFPDTYYFLPNATEDIVIEAMRQNFNAKIQPLIGDIARFGRPLPDVVTMASLLEREAWVYRDRRMIAGVLWRRLDKGMLLQVDAAFLYSHGRATYDLTREDLRSDTPYNTYKYKGLPPTPIGSPSLSSLRAAVNPIDQGFLFYLADRAGTTYYSKTYEEHLEKKRVYVD